MTTRIFIALGLALLAPAAQAQGLVVQLIGPGRAENAGYLLAEARNLYVGNGLEVTLLPPSDAPPFETLARGQADLVVEWMPAALVARENGLPLVNIGQIFASPTLRLACRADAGIADIAQLPGKTVASPFGGTEFPLAGWLNRAAVPLDSVTLIPQGDSAEMLRQKQADCISIRRFATAGIGGANLLDPAAAGAATLEDGIYALSPARPDDPFLRDRMARFLQVSIEGWRAAIADPEGSARLLLGPDPDEGALQRLTKSLQAMDGVIGDGRLNDAAYLGTVETLRAGGAGAVLKHPPEGAFTHDISDLAASMTPGVAGDPAR